MINIKFVVENNKAEFESKFHKKANVGEIRGLISKKIVGDQFLVYYRQKRLLDNNTSIEKLEVKDNDIMNVIVAKKIEQVINVKMPKEGDIIHKPIARISNNDYIHALRSFEQIIGFSNNNIDSLAREYGVDPSVVSMIWESLAPDYNAITEALSEMSNANNPPQQGDAMRRLQALKDNNENANLTVQEVIAMAELDYDEDMIQNIQEIHLMGFDVIDCFIAYERTRHDPEQAVNLLLPP